MAKTAKNGMTRGGFIRRSWTLVAGSVMQAIDSRIPDGVKKIQAPVFPPGAVPDFGQKCTMCGDCLPACPESAIREVLDETTGNRVAGIVPSVSACVMCAELPCVDACGDGFLERSDDGSFPGIGTAEINEHVCLAHNGIPCFTCYDACPRKGTAIRMAHNRPVITVDECSGCGICENACVLEDKRGVRITPRYA